MGSIQNALPQATHAEQELIALFAQRKFNGSFNLE